MRIRGALHVHSKLSHDGTLSVAEVAQLYARRNFQFVAMGEHSQDLDAGTVEQLSGDCQAHSGPAFLMIPGVEFTCQGGLHVLGAGCVELTSERSPDVVAHHIRRTGGFAVLAHPSRYKWQFAPEVLQAVQGVEIWNVAYDGKYLPAPESADQLRLMRRVNPDLLAVASHDLHRRVSFYDVAMEMEVSELTARSVLDNLRRGAYRIASRFFGAGSREEISGPRSFWLRFGGRQLRHMRRVRAQLLRFSQ